MGPPVIVRIRVHRQKPIQLCKPYSSRSRQCAFTSSQSLFFCTVPNLWIQSSLDPCKRWLFQVICSSPNKKTNVIKKGRTSLNHRKASNVINIKGVVTVVGIQISNWKIFVQRHACEISIPATVTTNDQEWNILINTGFPILSSLFWVIVMVSPNQIITW